MLLRNLVVRRIFVQLQIEEGAHTVSQLHHALDPGLRCCGHVDPPHDTVFPEPRVTVYQSIGIVAHHGISRHPLDGVCVRLQVRLLHRQITALELADRCMELLSQGKPLLRDNGVIHPSELGTFGRGVSKHHFRVIQEVLVDFIDQLGLPLDSCDR